MMPPLDTRATRIASTMASKSAPARMEGSESTNALTDPFGTWGRAKSAALALLRRDFSG